MKFNFQIEFPCFLDNYPCVGCWYPVSLRLAGGFGKGRESSALMSGLLTGFMLLILELLCWDWMPNVTSPGDTGIAAELIVALLPDMCTERSCGLVPLPGHMFPMTAAVLVGPPRVPADPAPAESVVSREVAGPTNPLSVLSFTTPAPPGGGELSLLDFECFDLLPNNFWKYRKENAL